MAYDFRSWLNIQPNDKEYKFHDCLGNCAVGQYMKSRGEKWDFAVYNDHIEAIAPGKAGETVFKLAGSHTFGELKAKFLELV